MILLIDNFLIKKECDQLVRWYKANSHAASLWPRNSTVKTATSFQISAPRVTNKLFLKIQKRAEDLDHKYYDKNLMIDRCDLVRHAPGCFHGLHYDMQYLWTKLASVIYLNTLSSGHTIFKEGLKVSPVAGRIVIFDGMKYKHGVAKVVRKDRYTMPSWYRYLN